MPVVSPFATFDPEGEIWEEGFMAGFNDPDSEHLRPLVPNLLEVYREGDQAGRDFRRAGPEDGGAWEGIAEIGVDAIIHIILHHVAKAFGGMAALVIGVLQIQGDTPLKPLPDDFRAPANQDDAVYVAVCLRKDHPLVIEGATSDGTWASPSRTAFADAASDMTAHGHAEAFVARCSVRDQTCGAVWAIN